MRGWGANGGTMEQNPRWQEEIRTAKTGTFSKRISWLGGLWAILAVSAIVSLSGCGEVKPLTPEQKSFMSAWKIGKEMGKAFEKGSPEAVENLLGPPLSQDPKTHIGLTRLFALLDKIDLRIVMDGGMIDQTGHDVVFRAHWTMAGVSKSPKAGVRYFQTGECRLVVSIENAPKTSRLLSLSGDTFLRAPATAKPPG